MSVLWILQRALRLHHDLFTTSLDNPAAGIGHFLHNAEEGIGRAVVQECEEDRCIDGTGIWTDDQDILGSHLCAEQPVQLCRGLQPCEAM